MDHVRVEIVVPLRGGGVPRQSHAATVLGARLRLCRVSHQPSADTPQEE
jgi:hypothetical protein